MGAVTDSARRILATPKVWKEPILAEHLKAMVARYAGAGAALPDVRTVTLCLISYAAFL